MPRINFPLQQNWLFHEKMQPSFSEKSCDETGFVRVTLPHTVRLVPYSGFDERIYQKITCYRRHFRLEEKYQGQRVFVDFEGAMTAARVFLNGTLLGEHRGGYTPFSFELTEQLDWSDDNVLAVELDSRERPDIPPFGKFVDYLTYGGIYREVALRIVHPTYIRNVFVLPQGISEGKRKLGIQCYLENGQDTSSDLQLRVEIQSEPSGEILHQVEKTIALNPEGIVREDLCLHQVDDLMLWDLDSPNLYQATVRLFREGQEIDQFTTRFGMRECRFTPEGFRLNGRLIPLRGLNRHQSYPWVGYAMPARVQRKDADILRQELKVNIVRTSHYPQSRHFLDRCDEVGLLVFEEIPGWQHIGDRAWQDLCCENVAAMIERDFNHPSIILWGVRINESVDCDELYERTNRIAHELDPTRQTGGVRCLWESRLLEDVFTFNDFNPEQLRTPQHPLYLVTEFGGHMYPTKRFDNVERTTEHTRRHAHVLSQAAQIAGIAGAIGWCAFDYNTHGDFGSGDRICHHGVCDMFRIPKYAAGVYRAQCSPEEEVVLEPAFAWTVGDLPGGGGVGNAIINSNCDQLKLYLADELITELVPDHERFPGLPHPPFFLDERLQGIWGQGWKTLRIDGYIGGEKVISRSLSHRGVDERFVLKADDDRLAGDGVDMTRVTFRVTDEFGNTQPFAVGAIQFKISGPGEIVGDNPFPLVGGVGAIWIRTTLAEGTIVLSATHPTLGEQGVRITVPEKVADTL